MSERVDTALLDRAIRDAVWDKCFSNLRFPPSGCWEWTKSLCRGYGVVFHKSIQFPTHRLTWQLLIGPIPNHLEIDHLCRNTRCCNPDHLEPVTHAENVRRGRMHIAKREKATCQKGLHVRTPETTVFLKNGAITCRPCFNAAVAKHKAKRRAEQRALKEAA